MNIVFDLDECLVSTREAHAMAYRSLGVEPDGLSRHLPAKCWMKDPVLYERKHEVFPGFLRQYGKILSTMPLFIRMSADAVILTGTSRRSVDALIDWFPPLEWAAEILTTMDSEDKIAWFNDHEPGVYFDDWTVFVERVREETKWQAIDVSGF